MLKAAIVGIPLPLCSCSVLPMALELQKSGLNDGGTAAFLISTPETGIDSILLTYSLTDPVLTVARPLAAFMTALTAGILINQIERPPDNEAAINNAQSCCCHVEVNQADPAGFFQKMKSALHYSWFTILKDLSLYLFFGFILAGLVATFLGEDATAVPDFLKNGWAGYLGAILVGLPMYICATSSTPLAAVLLSAGFSPGAILVFLLVGPATNITSLTVVLAILKRKALIIYLLTIIGVSVTFGFVLDYLYVLFQIPAVYNIGKHSHNYTLLSHFSAILLITGISYFLLLKVFKRLK